MQVPVAVGQPVVTLSSVGKRYANGTLAVQGVELAIGQGDFVSLLGPSGCGKSTVLRMVAGLMAPTTGSIQMASGGDATGDIGFVFQEPTLMPWSNALKNVMLPLRLAGVNRGEAADRAAAACRRHRRSAG